MSLADLVPIILATKMPERRQPVVRDKRTKYRDSNKRRNAWRAARRAKGLPVT